MKLHIFNPSHDEALAAGSPFYFPTAAARALEREAAALPAVFAAPGDAVLQPEGAEAPPPAAWCDGVSFVREREARAAFWEKVEEARPWGWDALLRHRLRKAGCPARLLPTDEDLLTVRRLSSRATAVRLLRRLRAACPDSVGESALCTTEEEARAALCRWGAVMAKAPWSCSGRGVFRLDGRGGTNVWNRVARLLREQGAVECEPFYDVLFNFAMEFTAFPTGEVRYEGLSLFRAAAGGAYGGNAVLPQPEMERLVAEAGGPRGDALRRLSAACCAVLSALPGDGYAGPFGVDMMLVRAAGRVRLHPCVEVNLRQTMGHAALALAAKAANAGAMPPALRKMWYFCP